MLWALGRTSGRPLPVIIDTPLARLDSDHRRLLVENYFPQASHQVILLSTDTEVDQLYFDLLNPPSHARIISNTTNSTVALSSERATSGRSRMKLTRLRLSKDASNRLRFLAGRTGLTPNLLCRIGFCLSLAEPFIPNPDAYPEEEREFNRYTLLGEYDALFIALLKERCREMTYLQRGCQTIFAHT